MKQKDVLTKNNDFLNVMFRGTLCILTFRDMIVNSARGCLIYYEESNY